MDTAPDGSPRSVVVKRPRQRDGDAPYDPDGYDRHTRVFFNEWAALQVLTEVCSDPLPAPRFYGGDRQISVIAMEDFGDGRRLDHALRGGDPRDAERMLCGLFETVGRMHAQTVGKEPRYRDIRAGLGPNTVEGTTHAEPDDFDKFRAVLDAIGIEPAEGFFDEFQAIRAWFAEPGSFLALVHGDPCPDNCHLVGETVRLLDFEHGAFRHALKDGVYPRIHFPTCWCVNRLPDDVWQRTEAAYRRELAKGLPDAMDDGIFYGGMVAASADWAWGTFALWFMPLIDEKDWEWGLSTVRQRVLTRFELLDGMIRANDIYPSIAETTRRTILALRERWQDVEEMPVYPAFRAAIQ